MNRIQLQDTKSTCVYLDHICMISPCIQEDGYDEYYTCYFEINGYKLLYYKSNIQYKDYHDYMKNLDKHKKSIKDTAIYDYEKIVKYLNKKHYGDSNE